MALNGLRTKILSGMFIPVLLLIAVGVIAIAGVNSMRETEKWVEHTHQVIAGADKILIGAINMETGMRGFLLAGKEEFLEPFEAGNRETFGNITALKETVSDNPQQVIRLDRAEAILTEWKREIVEESISLRRQIGSGQSQTMDDIAALIGEARGKIYFDEFRGVLAAFTQEESDLLAIRDAEQRAVLSRTFWAISGTALVALLISSVIGLMLSQSVLTQVGGEPEEIADLTNKIASGDLTMTFGVSEKTTGIHQSVKRMVESMRKVHVAIVQASDKISNTVGDISGASATQVSGAAEQAAAIRETMTTVTQIKETSEQTLEKALALSMAAERSRAEGDRGLAVLQDTAQSMESIHDKVEKIAAANLALSEQSKKIGEITNTINKLTHQSKMLGINASIEAAKAGDPGKGFAVVADEIHALAAQSEESTQQVHMILADIQRATDQAVMATEEGTKEVALGLALIDQSSGSINTLHTVIVETGHKSDQIVAAARQEVIGLDQISTAMGQIDVATRDFITSTRQMKDASEDMDVIVQNLSVSASAYKV